MASVNLDRESFRLWLSAKEPDEVVGTVTRCPLEEWVSHPLNIMAEKKYPDQEWIGAFVSSVDNTAGLTGGCDGWEYVTAKESLTILDSLETS